MILKSNYTFVFGERCGVLSSGSTKTIFWSPWKSMIDMIPVMIEQITKTPRGVATLCEPKHTHIIYQYIFEYSTP